MMYRLMDITNDLQAELEAWTAALTAYDEKDFSKSITLFEVDQLSCGWFL